MTTDQPATMSPLLRKLWEAHGDALRRQKVWVMDLDWWMRVRREFPPPGGDHEPDESKWKPEPGDTLMGRPVMVRDDGGEPHVEWLTREEAGL